MLIEIDGIEIKAGKNDTVLKAAKRSGIKIPSLCHHDALEDVGACRLCMVEVNHKHWTTPRMVTACEYKVEPGLIVKTKTADVIKSRHMTLGLLLSRAKNSDILKSMALKNGFEPVGFHSHIEEEPSCISCYLCVRVCNHLGFNAITMVNRGVDKKADAPYSTAPESCVGCGSCASVCPVNYIQIEDTEDKRTIWNREFEMVKCSSCGAPFISKAFAEYALNNRALSQNYYEKCPECKRVETASKFGRIGS
ncbi:MAG: (2Fe-2S)-binding protein [Deltaproteobacteria bacterium]|nr:(2Fe-2S)-binding protein [Deltaproteobacteria bacterium]